MRIIGGFAAVLLSACTMLGTGTGGRNVPADFAFVRDPDGILVAGEVEDAESQLRRIAERSGVFGIVVVARRLDEVPAPEAILDEAATLGGEAVIGFCTTDACELRGADVASVAMGEVIRGVAVPVDATGLQGWVVFVGAVADRSADDGAQP